MKMAELKPDLFDGKDIARTLLRERRMRSDYFDADIIADPVWELLLILYDAEETARVCATADLQQGSNMSADTLIRWIKVLERRGLLTTIGDARLFEGSLVKLTRSAHRAMTQYLQGIAQQSAGRF